MKKLIPIFVLILFYFQSNAQITLEHSFPYSATLTNVGNSGYKYYAMDVVNNQCLIYNTDFTVWKTVNLQIPTGLYLYDVNFISDHLFDTDAGVELSYTYYSYDTLALYYTYYTRIINEDGTVLLDLPGCYYSEIHTIGNNIYKYFAYIWDFSVYPSTLDTRVYSLPGVPSEVTQNSLNPGLAGAAFPNPAANSISIPYALPKIIQRAELKFCNAEGQEIRSYPINGNQGQLRIQTEGLKNGIYFYSISGDNGFKTLSQKIIISR